MKYRIADDGKYFFDVLDIRETVIIDQLADRRLHIDDRVFSGKAIDKWRSELQCNQAIPESQGPTRKSDRVVASQRFQQKQRQKLVLDRCGVGNKFVNCRRYR